jgi:hypothetical protein
MEKKMFGDTLKKQQELVLRQSMMRPQLRREKTFDMTLIHTSNEREKFTPKFSPQVQQKRMMMTTKATTTADERNMKSFHNSAIKYDRPSDEKMKTIDRKYMDKKKVQNFISKNVSNVDSTPKKYTKEVISKRISPVVTKTQPIPKASISPSRKIEPPKESKSSSGNSNNSNSNSESVKITQMIEKNQSQTDVVVRKFAEEVSKLSSADSRQIEGESNAAVYSR